MIDLIKIINIAFEILIWLLMIRIILSWFPHNRFNPIIEFIYNTTNPILKPFRNIINPMGGIDLSPIIVFFILRVLQNRIIYFLTST